MGKNLTYLSQLDGLSFELYAGAVLPRLLEQVLGAARLPACAASPGPRCCTCGARLRALRLYSMRGSTCRVVIGQLFAHPCRSTPAGHQLQGRAGSAVPDAGASARWRAAWDDVELVSVGFWVECNRKRQAEASFLSSLSAVLTKRPPSTLLSSCR